ncbi:MAG: DUF11 domain-containing protein [Planctomycetaceae bacterium]|nr:DUF11 domain-containing protein [Planctomycetaceae bacterium]
MNRSMFACALALLAAVSVLSGCDTCFPSQSSYSTSPTFATTQPAAVRVSGLPSPTTQPSCDLSVSRFLPSGDRSCAVIEVRKTAPRSIEASSTFTYRIEVTNLTQAPLQDVVIQETLPDQFDLSGATAGATRTGNTVKWNVGTLDASASRTFVLRGISSSGGNVMSCTRVDYAMPGVCLDMQVSPQEALVPVNAPATAAPEIPSAISSKSVGNEPRIAGNEPRLAVNISAPPRGHVGQNVVYVVHVANPGETPVSGVTVTSLLPTNAKFMEASSGGRVSDGQVTWRLDQLAPGQTREMTVIVKASQSGPLRTAVSATGRYAAAVGEAVTLVGQESPATAAPRQEHEDSDR